MKIIFLINPVAGLGGPLAWKGTGEEEGRRLLASGVKPVALEKADRFLTRFRQCSCSDKVMFLTAAGAMGEDLLAKHGFTYEVVHEPPEWPTRSRDTFLTVVKGLTKGGDIVVFVGGDGTARVVADALRSIKASKPILGVPAGVKMYSSVYGVTPEEAADALCSFIEGKGHVCEGEIVDIDEEAFRKDELILRLYAVVTTVCAPGMVGISKQPSPSTEEEEENKLAIARYIVENMRNCTLYILGPGSTVAAIAKIMRQPKTLLGVDVYHNKKLVARDVNEHKLLEILEKHGGEAYIIVTPIGGQGFFLGRGNQQISPRVVRKVGIDNIIVVATWSKIKSLGYKLRVDTGDPELDNMLRGYRRVVVDYNEEIVVKVV